MKKQLLIYTLLVAFAFGFASPAAAKQVTVQKGDSMWLIAKRYNIPFLEILRLNKHYLNQHLIHPYDKIEIPDHNTGTNTNTHSSADKIPSKENTSAESGTSTQAQEVLKLVNEERAKQGLKSLTLSSNLTSIANTKAKVKANLKDIAKGLIDLYAKEHFIAHKLLAEENSDNIYLVSAFYAMCYGTISMK